MTAGARSPTGRSNYNWWGKDACQRILSDRIQRFLIAPGVDRFADRYTLHQAVIHPSFGWNARCHRRWRARGDAWQQLACVPPGAVGHTHLSLYLRQWLRSTRAVLLRLANRAEFSDPSTGCLNEERIGLRR